MTKNHITVIFNLGNICSENKENNTIGKEKAENKKFFAQCDIKSRYWDIQMNKLGVNLKDAVDYLISLFYATHEKYSCSRIKLGKMLSIVAFRFARDGMMIFEEDIYRYKGCGATIYDLNGITSVAEYVRFKYDDDRHFINEDLSIAINSEIATNLTEQVRNVITDVFRRFGAFSQGELGKIIEPFVLVNGIVDNEGKIDLTRFSSLKVEDVVTEDYEDDLIKYLLE